MIPLMGNHRSTCWQSSDSLN